MRMKRREAIQASLATSIGLWPNVHSKDAEPLWSFTRASEADSTEVFQFDNEIYLVSDAIYAIDAKKGRSKWSYGGKATPVLETVAISNYHVCLRTSKGLVLLDRSDGSKYWTEPNINSSATDSESIYAANEGTLTAFERRKNKSQRWQANYEDSLWKSLAVAIDAVLVGTISGSVAAFETEDGVRRWTFSVPEDDYLQPLSGGRTSGGNLENSNNETILIWNSTRSILYGLRPDDGTRLWSYEFETDLSWFSGAVTDSRIVINDETQLRVVDSRTGEIQWTYSSPNGVSFSAPAVANDAILVNGDGTITSLSPKGAINWKVSLGDVSQSWIGGVGDEVMCVYEPNGTVYVLSTKTGERRRRYKLEKTLSTPPLVANETIYVATEDGTLFALDGTRKTVTDFAEQHDEAVGSGLVVAAALTAIGIRRLRNST